MQRWRRCKCGGDRESVNCNLHIRFNNEAIKSPALGFAFDSTKIATELTSVTNVYEEYQKSLEYGFVDPEVGIPEMLEKMNNAGLQKIIDEKQAQLDAWAAAR